MTYDIEAKGRCLNGRIIVGAKEGYDGKKEYSLEELASFLRQANAKMPINIPCIITSGVLIGRAGDSDYSENVFYIDFSQSPRVERLSREKFLDTLCTYADSLGSAMSQKRVYIDFDEETIVLKRR